MNPIKMARLVRNLKIRDVASASGISHTTLSKLENGKQKLSKLFYNRLVLGYKKLGLPLTPVEKQKIARYGGLNE